MGKGSVRAICLSLLCILGALPSSAAADVPVGSPVLDPVTASDTPRVGAYFFYWYVLPDQPELLPLDKYVAFAPPGASEVDYLSHLPPYHFPYDGGTYNTVYYDSSGDAGQGADPRRWWEWQFRDMAAAGLDFAVLNSWDGATFTRPETRIENVGQYLNAALDTLGDPLQVALYDDTTSEVYAWNLQVHGQLPPEPCMPPTAAGCESYRMPLSDPDNWQYFYAKMDAFYDAVDRQHWATLDGRPVDQGGRPLLLLHQGEGFFLDIVRGGTRYAAQLFCSLKKHWIERYSGPAPFLLPNGTWGLWGTGDPALQQPARCSTVGVAVPGDPFIIDGWSAYGMANGGVCSNPAYPGVCIFPYQSEALYTTAYLGPGVDLFAGSTTSAYSGPYGGEGPDYRPLYNARWWSLDGDTVNYCDDGHCQDRYYYQGWSVVTAFDPPADLVVIESWNELAEGSGIGKVTNYIAPDLMLGNGPPTPPLYFVQNPYHETPWSPWFWIMRSRDLIAGWRGVPPAIEVAVDDPVEVPGWFRDQGTLGRWFYGSGFHYALEGGTPAAASWIATLPQDGIYDVYAYWPQVQGATEDAHYTINHALGSALVRIDQSRYWDAGGWTLLGRYPFRGGRPDGRVTLTSEADNPQGRHVLADAVRFVYHGPWAGPSLTPRAFFPLVHSHWRTGTASAAAPAPAGTPRTQALAVPAGPAAYPHPTITPPPSPTPQPSPTPILLDHTAPQSRVDGLPAFSGQTSFWVDWTSSDSGSGVARLQVQSRDGATGTWQSWLPYAGTATSYGSAQEGHTYYFRSRATDWAGNLEAWPLVPDAATTVDLTPPTSRVGALPPYQQGPFAVTWAGQDNLAGVAAYDLQYCVDDCQRASGVWHDWLNGTAHTSDLFTEGQDGHTYYFRSRAHDRAGHTERWPGVPDAATALDATPPASAVSALPPYSHQSFVVNWGGQDGFSGLASYDVQYCQVGCSDPKWGQWNDWLSETTVTSATLEGEEGAFYFRSRARDRAGNVEEWPAAPDALTMVDVTAPDSRVAGLPAYSPGAFAVTWNGTDTASGVAGFDVQRCLSGCDDPAAPWSGWITATTALSATLAGLDGQSYAFRSRAYDCMGNVEEWPAVPDAWTVVDTRPPSATIAPLPAYSPAVFTVTWSGQDGGAGVTSYDLQVRTADGTVPGEWTDWLTRTALTAAPFHGTAGQVLSFRSRAWDAVGNHGEYPSEAEAWTQVDASGPQTWFESSAGPQPGDDLHLAWAGQDDLSGLAGYDLYVRDESEPDWTAWLQGVTFTQALFAGQPGHTYHLCLRGVDQAGNREAKECPQAPGTWPVRGERTIALAPTSRVNDLPPLAGGSIFLVQWAGRPALLTYDIQVRDKADGLWRDWLVATRQTSAWFNGVPGHSYSFRSRALGPAGNVLEPWPWDYDAWTMLPRQE